MLAAVKKEKYPYNFILYYAFSFMAPAIFAAFLPVYLSTKGYNQTAIGTLLAVGPVVTVMAQPAWGVASDKSRYKNNVLLLITLGTAFTVLLYNFSAAFPFLVIVTAVFTTFSSGITPVADTIILDHLEKKQRSFGPVRMGGTIGYAVMAIIAGYFAQKNIKFIFILYAVVVGFSLLFTARLPKVKGYYREIKSKVSIIQLFKNRGLVLFLVFNLIISIISCFYSNFFPIYYKQTGADNVLLGWATFIATISEIPFLIFADRILNKIGTRNCLALSAAISAIRWISLYLITNVYINLVLQILHGLNFIVFNYSMVTYINKEAPKEFKTTAQAIYTLSVMGIARIVGGLLGGYLSDCFGIRQIFLLNTMITIAAIILFLGLFYLLPPSKSYKNSSL